MLGPPSFLLPMFVFFTFQWTPTSPSQQTYFLNDPYSHKNMLQNYAANLYKRVPSGEFPHKLNACSFHYTIDCVAFFSLT